jgi:hypothetical protein
VIGDVALDRVFEVGDGLEDAAPESEAFAVAHESGIGIRLKKSAILKRSTLAWRQELSREPSNPASPSGRDVMASKPKGLLAA